MLHVVVDAADQIAVLRFRNVRVVDVRLGSSTGNSNTIVHSIYSVSSI